jgi:uncharacterized membrane protein
MYKEGKLIRKKSTIFVMFLALLSVLALTACSGQAAAVTAGGKNVNATIKQTNIKALVTGNTVTIPVSAVDKNGNTNFRVDTATDYFMFMAYEYGDKMYVRADVCVPCGSESFTLKNGTLVCNSCGTVFNAQTGVGVSGAKACMSYSKQPVPFQVTDGNIVMTWTDMSTAYQNTLNRTSS